MTKLTGGSATRARERCSEKGGVLLEGRSIEESSVQKARVVEERALRKLCLLEPRLTAEDRGAKLRGPAELREIELHRTVEVRALEFHGDWSLVAPELRLAEECRPRKAQAFEVCIRREGMLAKVGQRELEMKQRLFVFRRPTQRAVPSHEPGRLDGLLQGDHVVGPIVPRRTLPARERGLPASVDKLRIVVEDENVCRPRIELVKARDPIRLREGGRRLVVRLRTCLCRKIALVLHDRRPTEYRASHHETARFPTGNAWRASAPAPGNGCRGRGHRAFPALRACARRPSAR